MIQLQGFFYSYLYCKINANANAYANANAKVPIVFTLHGAASHNTMNTQKSFG